MKNAFNCKAMVLLQENKASLFNICHCCYENNVFVSEWFELFSKRLVFFSKRILGSHKNNIYGFSSLLIKDQFVFHLLLFA